jgi:hypothetical protein
MSTTFQVKHPGALKWSQCSGEGCRRPVIWVETANGRRTPLDCFEPGLFGGTAGELVRVSSDDSHWASCPARAEFVKGRK